MRNHSVAPAAARASAAPGPTETVGSTLGARRATLLDPPEGTGDLVRDPGAATTVLVMRSTAVTRRGLNVGPGAGAGLAGHTQERRRGGLPAVSIMPSRLSFPWSSATSTPPLGVIVTLSTPCSGASGVARPL